jgi:hypothetical protein
MNYIDIDSVGKNLATSIMQVSIGYNSIDGLLDAYSIKQERSLVQAQNKVALSQYLPTNSTLFLKNEKQKREKLKYVTPDNWTDAFKLIKLIWQTRQLA